MSTKGEERKKKSEKEWHHRGLSIPREGSIPAAEEGPRAAVIEVNARFHQDFKEPYDIMHGGKPEHQALYCRLVGI